MSIDPKFVELTDDVLKYIYKIPTPTIIVEKNKNIYRLDIIKIKIHSSCEIEYFAETQNSSLQAVCDTPIPGIY